MANVLPIEGLGRLGRDLHTAAAQGTVPVMARWHLDDLPWSAFRPELVEPRLLAIVKAAALVEHNAASYGSHLQQVFAGDADFTADVQRWSAEEIQHGEALARWVALADPAYDHQRALAEFAAVIRAGTEDGRSRRGSRRGEMIARAVVEVGTSSFYSALAASVREPLLGAIVKRIAADEFAHYRLFSSHQERLASVEPMGRWARLRVALGRMGESGDDELAYALCCALGHTDRYRRKPYAAAYAAWSMAAYGRDEVHRAATMVCRATGLGEGGWLVRMLATTTWWLFRLRRGLAAWSARSIQAAA
jgi:rubrerythrin